MQSVWLASLSALASEVHVRYVLVCMPSIPTNDTTTGMTPAAIVYVPRSGTATWSLNTRLRSFQGEVKISNTVSLKQVVRGQTSIVSDIFYISALAVYFREAFLLVLSGRIIASYPRVSKSININCSLAVSKE